MVLSCKPNASQYINFIEGYWEIEQVTKTAVSSRNLKSIQGLITLKSMLIKHFEKN